MTSFSVDDLRERVLAGAKEEGGRRSDFSHPLIVELKRGDDPSPLLHLFESVPVEHISDHFIELLEELFFIRQPILRFSPADQVAQRWSEFLVVELGGAEPADIEGSWVYLPWRKTLLRLLGPERHQELRTARNRGVIPFENQEKYYGITAGIAGLSVGGVIATTICLEGGAGRMKIADFDHLSGSNLNRIRASFVDVGRSKTQIIAEQVYELNPYQKLELFDYGLTLENCEEFIAGRQNIDVLIEEIDDMQVKIALRLVARRKRIPVLMATNLGHRVVLDVERFDHEPERPLFHGALGDQPEKWLDRPLTNDERVEIMFAITGRDVIPGPLQKVSELLKEGVIERPPQLGGTVAASGGIVSRALYRLANDLSLPSGRTVFLDEIDHFGGASGDSS